MEEQKLLKRKRKVINEGNKDSLVSVCIDLADYYFRKEKYTIAIKEYKVVADIYYEQERGMDYARVHRMIGEAYTHLREFNKALKHQEIHLGVAREKGDKMEEQRALATIGHTYLTSYLDLVDNPEKKALNLASKAFMKSLNICERLTDISKREQMDMISRLFANLGIVQECQGNYQKGIELMERSINICKSNDLYEQLQRGHMALASLYNKQEDHSNAIHHINLAFEVSGRLENKITLMGACYSLKSDILIKLADFHGAKTVLVKAYKLKVPNKIEREAIESTLKVVAAMCYTEDALLISSETDYAGRKKLYEKMGDGACILKNFPKAIEYYEKMLECALKKGDTGKDLSACYVSLAETCKDNKEYDSAINYFKMDYEICKGNLKESLSTIFNLVDVMELAGKYVDDILTELNNARLACKNAGDRHLEGKALSRYIALLKHHNQTECMKTVLCELEDLDYIESENEELEESVTENIGEDIDLENITDLSDTSDSETNTRRSKSSRKRPRSTFLIKRNNKGETQLHTACIGGNAILVRKLLDQGHVVNTRDHCGWLPLHEACNCGHLEIVKMLIEKGASINDRGGTLCNGMTPLHDACSNGHLQIIEYLLDKGASAIAKTDEGLTPLQVLREWRKNNELNAIDQSYYETLIERMSAALEKVGQSKIEVISSKENKALVYQVIDDEEDEPRPKRVLKTNLSNRCIGDLRKNMDDFNDYKNTDTSTNEYKDIMDSLRHRNVTDVITKRKSSNDLIKRPALLAENDVGDDWLDDDLMSNSKKRKINAFITGDHIRSRKSSTDDFEIIAEVTPKKYNRKTQSTLINAGFTRNHDIDSTFEEINRCSNTTNVTSSQKKRKTQVQLNNFVNNTVELGSIDNLRSEKKVAPSQTLTTKMLSIDVKIEGKLFRIPIPAAELDVLTMKWLADEATKRFYKKEAMKPHIELETKNGAMLSEDDFISILFPLGGNQGEEVQAKVVKWNIPPISERYKDACMCLNEDIDHKLLELIESTAISLHLQNQNLRSKLAPLCKALNRQSNLYELNLSGNFMSDICIEQLCLSFSTMDNLVILNISSNNLTSQSLNYISSALQKYGKPALKELHLSDNPLKDESFKYLSAITNCLQLKTLTLSSVDFTSNIFQLFCNSNLQLNLSFVENIDLSYNKLSRNNLSKFLNWLQPLNLNQINFGNNKIEKEGFGSDFFHFLSKNEITFLNITSMNLSRCKINDDDILKLLNKLNSAPNFLEVDLSFNNLTSISLKRLLENKSLQKINVSCCDGIPENLKNELNNWNFSSRQDKRELISTLNYAENYEECDILINIWKNEYKVCTGIKGIEEGMLHLLVNN